MQDSVHPKEIGPAAAAQINLSSAVKSQCQESNPGPALYSSSKLKIGMKITRINKIQYLVTLILLKTYNYSDNLIQEPKLY